MLVLGVLGTVGVVSGEMGPKVYPGFDRLTPSQHQLDINLMLKDFDTGQWSFLRICTYQRL